MELSNLCLRWQVTRNPAPAEQMRICRDRAMAEYQGERATRTQGRGSRHIEGAAVIMMMRKAFYMYMGYMVIPAASRHGGEHCSIPIMVEMLLPRSLATVCESVLMTKTVAPLPQL